VADRVERLTNLLALLLSTKEALTLEQINDRLQAYPEGEAGRRAFERDKDLLRSEGVPVSIEYREGAGGAGAYRVRAEDYYLPPLDLDGEERVALHLALAAVRFESGWQQQVRWKLGEAEVDAAPPLAALPTVDALPALFDASRQRASVTFGYHGERRTVDPWGLLFRGGFWYLIGHDHGRGEQRTFRVDRIDDGKVVPGEPGSVTAEEPAGFDLTAALPDDPLLIGVDPPVAASVLVDGALAAKVEAEHGEDTVVERRDDGSVVVQVDVVNRAAFRSWLLGLRDHATVLGPADLRAEIVAWLSSFAGAAG
jgi:predicted DNA-binding transcriptional regulator YafY